MQCNATPNQHSRPRRGLGALDVIVVLVLAALLAVLLLRTRARLSANAQRSQCGDHLRQIYTAASSLAHRNSGHPHFAGDWIDAIRPLLTSSDALRCPAASRPPDNADDELAAARRAPGWPRGSAPGSSSMTGFLPAPPWWNDWAIRNLLVVVNDTNLGMPCVPGTFTLMMAVTPTSYELSFEDQGGSGGGDFSYHNIQLQFTQIGPGTVSVTIQRSYGAYTSDLVDARSRKLIFSNIGEFAGAENVGKVACVVHLAGDTPGDSEDRIASVTQYGINPDADAAFGRADKILWMDYLVPWADTGVVGDNWALPYWHNAPDDAPALRFAVHDRRANVCFGDGSVRAIDVSGGELNPRYLQIEIAVGGLRRLRSADERRGRGGDALQARSARQARVNSAFVLQYGRTNGPTVAHARRQPAPDART